MAHYFRMWASIRLVVVFLLLCGSVGFRVTGAFPRSLIRIDVHRFAFEPNSIELKKGRSVTLSLTSDDVEHGLTIPGLGVDVHLPAGVTTAIVLTPRRSGTFTGYCNAYCGADHHAMSLTVEVRQ